MSRKCYPREPYHDKTHPKAKRPGYREDAEIIKLLETCLPHSVRSKCSLCGQPRSSKRQNALLANISTPKTLTVEVNHHYYNGAGAEPTEPCDTAELHGASSLANRVELPGEAVYRPCSRAHTTEVRRLLFMPEIAPPLVNMSRKPTYGIENTRKCADSF
ncbi:hypothetical protein B0J11DRAFT_512239 [Dendryphion nanum]|uniref:Uncharacterized protein n=1 Tax=Dendryphion nanum TaxID=256645 RepID=A0A9P9I8Q3_9PLEO|nr:hypothetical protein B0J11DRAFT_512239 [Dendryphion nanum]